MAKQYLYLMNKFYFYLVIFCIASFNIIAEGYLKAKNGIEWDSKNQIYTAFGGVEFSNDNFLANAEKIEAQYIIENNEEKFNVIELFNDVIIKFSEEIFKGDYAIYTKEDGIINIKGNVIIQSPTRLLFGDELILDLNTNKRTLNSINKDSHVEVLLNNESSN